VAAWSGILYVAFGPDITPGPSSAAPPLAIGGTKLVLDAIDMALWRRDRTGQPRRPE